ncbi:MAG: hypothetical protein E7Z86_02690 [Methanosphaera stadtmanae]|nr:hypothetical protein [Methanosphaera stadtmanae]
MNKKVVYSIIVLIIIIILVIVSYGYLNSNSGNLTFGNHSQVSAINGFKHQTNNEGRIIFKNNVTIINVDELNPNENLDEWLDKFIKRWGEEYKIENSSFVYKDNFTVRNTTSFKDDKFYSAHYLFKKNNKTFHIYLKGNQNETAVMSLIDSIH